MVWVGKDLEDHLVQCHGLGQLPVNEAEASFNLSSIETQGENNGIAVGAMKYHMNYTFFYYASFQNVLAGSLEAEYQCIWSIKEKHVKAAIPMQRRVTFVSSLSGSSSQQYGSLILHPW